MEDQNYNHANTFQIVVLMVPLPAQGHLNQLLHLSNLITSYNIQVHYAGLEDYNHQAKTRLHGWSSETLTKIHFHDLIPSTNDKNSPKFSTPIFNSCILLRNPMSRLIQNLSDKFRRVIVIYDAGMSYAIQDVKLITNVEAYAFKSSSAFYFFVHMWEILSTEEKPFKVSSVDIPENLPTNEGCATPETWDFLRYQGKFVGFESGYVYNTSRVFEGKYVNFMEKLTSMKGNLKHFALGPFHPMNIIITEKSVKERHECLNWLDKQEKDSVIYVAFGSVTSLSDEQIRELANGLERCGMKFIWVLRKADPNIFAEANEVPQLPQGYEERVKHRGIVVRDWAPQLEILAHGSVGGFMSHCGWNSCIESISMGVPIVAWPMHSDQPRNAIFLSQVLKIGVLVRDWEHRGEIVRSSTIERVVKKLMASNEGKEMQERAKELGEAVRRSVDEGGVSRLDMDSFIAHISR